MIGDRAKPLKECVQNGYAGAIKRHHNFVMKGVFNVACGATPKRDVFEAKLAPTVDEVYASMSQLQPLFASITGNLQAYLEMKEMEKPGE